MATLGPTTAAPSIHRMTLRGNARRSTAPQPGMPPSKHPMGLRNDPSARLPPSVVLRLICLLPIGLYDDY
jgi:hypothetical protein